MTGHADNNDIIIPSGITRIVFNKKEKNPGNLKSIISTLSDRNILIEKSGYIFNSSINGNCLCLGILPYFINAQRTNHYDIELPENGKCMLRGFINSNETFSLFFKPQSDTYDNGFLPGMADLFCDNYVRLARFFIENGFSVNFKLDFSTKSIFEETKMFTNIPNTVKELALQAAPYDIASLP